MLISADSNFLINWISISYNLWPGVGSRVGPPEARSGYPDFSGCGLRARAGHRRAGRARAEGRRAGFFGSARFEPDFSNKEKNIIYSWLINLYIILYLEFAIMKLFFSKILMDFSAQSKCFRKRANWALQPRRTFKARAPHTEFLNETQRVNKTSQSDQTRLYIQKYKENFFLTIGSRFMAVNGWKNRPTRHYVNLFPKISSIY